MRERDTSLRSRANTEKSRPCPASISLMGGVVIVNIIARAGNCPKSCLFVCVFCAVWFFFGCFVVCLFGCWDHLLDYVQVHYELSFVAICFQTAVHNNLQISVFAEIERVKRPGGSHEGVGRKKYFFDGWRVQPTLNIPTNLTETTDAPVYDTDSTTRQAPNEEPNRSLESLEEVARDILAGAAKNQAEDCPNTRRAAIRACKYLRAMVNKHGLTVAPELTSELLHCLS